MKPHRWHSPYKSFLLSIILVASCLIPFKAHALDWIVVTSEADSGAGTLREAIDAVNSGGGMPDAIAFVNNVNTIFLQSNLPEITNSVVIDGLAMVNNGSVIQEGNCELVPSPVDNPQGFSASLRVTIDSSTIPDTVNQNERWGLQLGQPATIRGLRIKNITVPGNGSRAVGILFIDGSVNNLVECCEIDQVQNRAQTTTFNDNRAVGIENEQRNNLTTISKCYIHNIEGGSIINCEGTITNLRSGHAYGIINCELINTCRIECITSGSINTSCNNNLQAAVGRSVGIAANINKPGFPPSFPCDKGRLGKAEVNNCPIACDQECLQSFICIQNNLICNIHGGDVTTSQPEVFLTETAGILLGSPFSNNTFNEPALVQNNTIREVHSGDATVSGDGAISITLGSFGILLNGDNEADNVNVDCNTVNEISTGSTTVEGEGSAAFPGYTYGIYSTTINSASILCNQISNICGATATVTGTCSVVTDDIDDVCQFPVTRHTPGGAQCTENERPIVAGIISENLSGNFSDTVTVNNNEVKNVHGGKRFAQGSQSSISTIGSAGIYTRGREVLLLSNQNMITSIIGTELVAQPGSLGIIKQEGTVGLYILGITITASENQIELVCEGRIRAAQNTLGINLTEIFDGLTKTHLDIDTALPYAPVITSGIIIARQATSGGPARTRNCTNKDPWCIADNTVNTVIGSAVTGGLQPLGSIAVGIWLQPVLGGPKSRVRSFESCATARQNNETNGTAFNNTINNITGGTNVPAYGIFLDGSAHFFTPFVPNDARASTFFTVDKNTITNICGSKDLPVFEVNLSSITGFCSGSGSENLEKTAFPFLPFEPTSGIYTLFGGCSTLSNNIIKEVKAFGIDARGITTAASSDMLITENNCSKIKGYGIFVGGVIATIDVAGDLGTDPNDITLESFASVRNKIHTNATFNNTNKGIQLGLIDWSNALFGIENLNVCPSGPTLLSRSLHNAETVPEDSVAIFGNHGQPEPQITKMVCNSNGTITIDISLKDTHRLTNFTVQFFRNSSNLVPQGEQAISNFDDPLFVFTTDFGGNAHKRFTFILGAEIQAGDTITAHVTVNNLGQAAVSDTYFCDTSEFGGQKSVPCTPKVLTQQSNNKPSTTCGFAALLNR